MRLVETPSFKRFVKYIRPSIKEKSFIMAKTLKKEIMARSEKAADIIRESIEVRACSFFDAGFSLKPISNAHRNHLSQWMPGPQLPATLFFQ
jgi:hypothetical protein